MGDDAGEAVAALHGERRRGAVVEGDRCGGGGGGGWVSGSGRAGSVAGTVCSGSSSSTSSLFSSTSSLTDEEEEEGEDGATSSSRPDCDVSSSSLSSLTSSGSETTTQMGAGAAGGPLDALSTMMEDLPALRTGLSKFYQGRSQSFTSLADVSCVEDLAKKTTPYIRRKKTPRRYAELLGAKNRLSKTIAKKAPRGKPPAYQCKREVYRC